VVYDRDGRPLAHVHLPERCANLCFGGRKNNRLFLAASHSLYAVHVNVRGAI
jgi:gluconolactonase